MSRCPVPGCMTEMSADARTCRFHRPRETVYMGITMRSRLEARFARWLDANGLVWRYEPRAFSSRTGEYLPDFEITGFGTPLYVEVKPAHERTEEVERAMERMEIVWGSEPTAILLIVFGDTGKCLRTVGRRWEVEPELPGWVELRAA